MPALRHAPATGGVAGRGSAYLEPGLLDSTETPWRTARKRGRVGGRHAPDTTPRGRAQILSGIDCYLYVPLVAVTGKTIGNYYKLSC